MGRTRHEISGLRKTGDHPARRAIPFAGAPHAGETRHSKDDLLVQSLSHRRARSFRRSLARAGSSREPDPRRGARSDHQTRARRADAIATRARRALHRHGKLFRVRGFRLSPAKAHDLIASPAFIMMKAADEFKNKTTAPNELWQTDFTYLKVIGWGWFYLSTVLDDFSRYTIAWKLCPTMKAEDVTATLDLALKVSGLDQAKVIRRPRLLSDNVLRAEGDRIGGQSFSVREYALAA